MYDVTTVVGIDPGIIHTGCVALEIRRHMHTIAVDYELIQGVDIDLVHRWAVKQSPGQVFIEDYNPGNYVKENKKMSEALGRLKTKFPPADKVLYVDNAGVNTLIPKTVLACFGVDVFPIATHHNDLVSAGKIALLGMLKDPELRPLISQVVEAKLKGNPWKLVKRA